MAKLGPYQVLARDLPIRRSFDVPPTDVGAWLRGMPMRDALGAPDPDPEAGAGTADLELYAEGTHAFAAGTFRGHLHVACSRCVSAVRLDIDERIRVTFMPKHELPAEDDAAGDDGEGAEVSEEDLDLFPYDGEVVDLEPLFREQFVLAIPYAPLCREDCQGLCPQCGIDRNTDSCRCEPPIDPRLAKLATLRGLKSPS